jgi:hypothetical protein
MAMEINHIIWLATALGAIIILAVGIRKNNYPDMLLGLLFFFYATMHLIPGEGSTHRYAALFFSLCIVATGIYKVVKMPSNEKRP